MNHKERLGIIITLSIAMLGATTVVMYGAIKVEAAPQYGVIRSWVGTNVSPNPPTQRNLIA